MAQESHFREIRRLLFVIFGSVFFAFFIALYFISYHSPSGKFIGGDSILNPEVLAQLRYVDQSDEKKAIYVFDRIDFDFFDINEKKWKTVNIDLERYQIFFDVIAKDESVSDDNLNLSDLFGRGFSLGILNIKVRKESDAYQSKVFQEITFSSDGNYYRVNSPYQKDFFAYFYHPRVYHQAITLLDVQ